MAHVVCSCGRKVETDPEWAGRWITCPGCGGPLYSPFPGPKLPPAALPASALPAATAGPGPSHLCPACAETIPDAEPRCRYCGAGAPVPIRVEARPLAAPPADSGGLPILILSLVGYASCGLLCPIAWKLGANYERDCARRGVAPSSAGRAGKIVGLIGTIFLLLNVVTTLIYVVARCL